MKSPTVKLIFVIALCLSGINIRAQEEQLKLEILNGHSGGGVLAVAVSSDGKFALTSSTNQTALLWNLETGNNYNQGLLTYSLLEGIKGFALQKPTENVDVRLLFDYAEKRVENLAKGLGLEQRPLIKQPSGNTFVIGQMTDEEKRGIELAKEKPLMLRPNLGMVPRNNDPLNLTAQLRKALDAESSYAVVKQRGEREPALIYIDDDSLPNAVQITGTYTIEGDEVKVKAYLFKGDTEIAALEINESKTEVINKLLVLIRTELARLI